MHAHFAPKYDQKDVPTPTTRPPAIPSSGTLRRAKTLTRPERRVAPVPLINPNAGVGRRMSVSGAALPPSKAGFDAWTLFSKIVTFWAPAFLLRSLGGLRDKQVQQAWREKITLCAIAAILMAFVGFATVGFQKVFCPQTSAITASRYIRVGDVSQILGIQGIVFNTTKAKSPPNVDLNALAAAWSGQDITNYFGRSAAYYDECNGKSFKAATDPPCSAVTPCLLDSLNSSTLDKLGLVQTHYLIGYDWAQVSNLTGYFVLDGVVLNMRNYLTVNPKPISGDPVDTALRTMLNTMPAGSAKDGTRLFYSKPALQASVACLQGRYGAGNIDKISAGCFLSNLLLYAGLIVIMGLVIIRFVMACIFNWFISKRLAGPPSHKLMNRKAISPGVLPEGANIAVDNHTGTAPWAGPNGTKRQPSKLQKAAPNVVPVMSLNKIGAELFAVCLVTCYSEGEESIRTTLDSISATTYADSRKLLFVVADGMITGAGEKRSTPDICVQMLQADPRFGNPIPMGYYSVGMGTKAENRAMVYAGHYCKAGRRTPTIIVVKCGTEKEATDDKKPGNRGKRDSQLILMNFFSRVTYNDVMSPLDFDLFRKIHVLMGVTPDFFEVCLMVDADTKVYPDSLRSMVNCMQHDPLIMGVCGETRIANKRASWVTAIQVYEYFISHHMAKAFEAVFGGVTCLPGCFSMFRLKGRKVTGDDWIPLIIKPEIVKEYSQSEVSTLHQKNLLLLGEDRFLTTILLRTFPNRKMMFLPQARCRTVVPDTFKILLSQRRRWINSTVHNLMELVLVRNLCGTFCFSMQFVVFMDLLGTVVVPVAIVLTYVLLVTLIQTPPRTFEAAIPAMALGAVLGLPAVLILITTRKVVYVTWMLAYLLALPIWSFVLPLYSFWNFDDFSWGETRKVEGEGKDLGHGGPVGALKPQSIPLRRWEDWERSRLRKLKREERRRREFDRNHPSGYNSEGFDDRLSTFDSASMHSEEDQWGMQIGAYNEYGSQYPPPPVGLQLPEALASAETIAGDDLEAMLEMGFDDTPSKASTKVSSNKVKYQLSDGGGLHAPTGSRTNGYTPLDRAGSPNNMTSPSMEYITTPPMVGSSGVQSERRTHMKQRSGGGRSRTQDQYGPLGPLDPTR